ncbi:Tetratricopeptide-like helical domain containing protein [Trema orientale]|uniref:Tetratricopeptide-like helical domain containing protein n=1 Tax=Trema orientale TaxID=63057 RepID=A0A2P5B4M8_TREOI|nr:Tetratricopeptide-like helical domain containing protein [Trema orientale]
MATNTSSNFSGKIKHVVVMVAKAAPLVLLGAGAFAAYTSWRKKPPVLKRSTSLALLHGDEMALQRLVEFHESRADTHRLDSADCEFRLALIGQQKPNFRELTRVIAKLEMSGKEDKAIKLLEEEFQKAQNNGKTYEAYEIEMLLVEMLIYKGDFKKALRCKCLSNENVSDARRPLYNAIIHIALEPSKKKEAEAYWEKFIDLRTHFGFQPVYRESMEETGIYKISTNFQEFERIVKKLQQDIKKARNMKLTL